MNLSPLGEEWSKPCNPYVIVQLLPDYRHQLQSTVHKKTTNPRFEETFEFEVTNFFNCLPSSACTGVHVLIGISFYGFVFRENFVGSRCSRSQQLACVAGARIRGCMWFEAARVSVSLRVSAFACSSTTHSWIFVRLLHPLSNAATLDFEN